MILIVACAPTAYTPMLSVPLCKCRTVYPEPHSKCPGAFLNFFSGCFSAARFGGFNNYQCYSLRFLVWPSYRTYKAHLNMILVIIHGLRIRAQLGRLVYQELRTQRPSQSGTLFPCVAGTCTCITAHLKCQRDSVDYYMSYSE